MARFLRPLITKSRKGEYPIAPFVYLDVATFQRDGDQAVTIGPQLMSVREVDELVDGVIEELENFRKVAKRALTAKEKS